MATIACSVSVAGAYVNGSVSGTNYFGSYPGGSKYYAICLKIVIPAVAGGVVSSLSCSISGTNNNNNGAVAAKAMRYGFTTSSTNTIYASGSSTGGDGTFTMPYCSAKYVTVTGTFDKTMSASMDSALTRYLWIWAGDVSEYSWYTYAGCSVTVTYTTSNPRPSNWSWYSAIASGASINLSATEWNTFCSRINEFRAYAGLTQYYFTTVYSGTAISAAICNEAWYAINAISGHGTMPSMALSGGPLYASFFTGLRDALNAVS